MNPLLIFYILAVLLGALVGLFGSGFRWCITALHQFVFEGMASFHAPSALLLFMTMVVSIGFVLIAWWGVYRFAPEASGSGVPEIEKALIFHEKMTWKTILPVKFLGGILSNASFLIVGREGPSIQIGGSVGAMLGQFFTLHTSRIETLIAAGAAAGLTAAFNAPIAGILFVIEEMRDAFHYSLTNFSVIAIACLVSGIITTACFGSQADLVVGLYQAPALSELWLFSILGLILGIAGRIFNHLLMYSLSLSDTLSLKGRKIYVVFVGGLVGLLGFYHSNIVGGGYEVIFQVLSLPPSITVIFLILIARFILMLLSYSTGVPGGIFAPLLALGTLFGVGFAKLAMLLLPLYPIELGVFAVAGMGGFFAAVVRAPLTGIMLVVELTHNYELLLPMMVTCFVAMVMSQLCHNEGIYTQLLHRRQKQFSEGH